MNRAAAPQRTALPKQPAAKKAPSPLARLGKAVIALVAALVFAWAAFSWIWSGLMLSWFFIAVFFLIMMIAMWAWTLKAFAVKYMIFTALALGALLAAHDFGIRQIQSRFDALEEEVAATGHAELDVFEKALLWQTHLIMAGSWTLSGDPWTGLSMALMAFPSEQRTLPAWLRPAPGAQPYHQTSPEGGYFDYPLHGQMKFHVPLYGTMLHVDAALLHSLEEAGWLHAYHVQWDQ